MHILAICNMHRLFWKINEYPTDKEWPHGISKIVSQKFGLQYGILIPSDLLLIMAKRNWGAPKGPQKQ